VLWSVLHHDTTLLQANSYVRWPLLDFSKTFDVVAYGVLATKPSGLDISPVLISTKLGMWIEDVRTIFSAESCFRI